MSMLDHRCYLAHRYAVVDPLLVPADLWCDVPCLPLAPVDLKSQQGRLAQLLLLGEIDDALRMEFLDRASVWERSEQSGLFSALIATDIEPAGLQAHLRRLHSVTGPGGEKALFRSYASEVFFHIRSILQPDQLRQWFGPIKAWTWRRIDGTWQTHQCPDVTLPAGRPSFTKEQWQRLTRVGVVNRLLRSRLERDPSLSIDDALRLEAESCVVLAYDTLDTTDEPDVLALAGQCLDYGPSIVVHPDIASRLQRALAAGTTYVGACADLAPSSLGPTRERSRPTLSERKHCHAL